MGVKLPKLTRKDIDDLAEELVFHLVCYGIEEKQNLTEEQQLDYEKWEKSKNTNTPYVHSTKVTSDY